MTNITSPIASKITVLINGTPVGALQSYSEKTVRNIQMLRALGSTENQKLHIGAAEHIVTLRYLMPCSSPLVEASADPHELQGFTLRINSPDRAIVFSKCEYASIETSCDVGQSIVCEAVIHALSRTCIEGEE